MKRLFPIILAAVLLGAPLAAFAQVDGLSTSGKCRNGRACNLGNATNTSMTFTTDGGTVVLDGSVTASAGVVATTVAASGALTAASVAATAAVTGATVTATGAITGLMPVISLASGALTPNSVHLATATAADYDLPATFCAATANIGNWVTVVVEDASSTISITVDDTDNVIIVPLLSLGADDELDSVSNANGEGTHITLVCLAIDGIYATSMSDIAGVIAWADGGTAD